MPSMLSRLRGEAEIERRANWPELFQFNGQLHSLRGFSRETDDGRGERSGSAFQHFASRAGEDWSTVAAAVDMRATMLSQVRFQWLGIADSNRNRRFGSTSLTLLEDAPGGLPMSQLMYRFEQDVSFAGVAYPWRDRSTGDLRRLRPDWVDVILTGNDERADIAGYSYHVNGRHSGDGAILIDARDVKPWAPEPDPLRRFVGRSWITSLVTDIVTDQVATEHVHRFFSNAATPSMIVEAPPGITQTQFRDWVSAMDEANAGLRHSGKTMYVVNGVGTTPVGSKLDELDMKNVSGGVENRVAVRSRIPAVLLGVREAMQGSSLNAGNYGQTRRLWADSWVTPYLQRFCDHMQQLFDPGEVPLVSRLTFDPTQIMLLQEDVADSAEIAKKNAEALETLHRAGFDMDAAVDAVAAGDMRRLSGRHTGLPSVQNQPDAEPRSAT